ncbi:hypothetical protein AXFE_21960 [Acidithrix ferrooxidans]|uniref:Uncharacterized protein n=1 Tax=Acidithrix ferrooxidans TaxID=1280514 RepID=A0A0D8HG66_9ACTN|nr:hypothetical protein AXFE_21960 [Acidithrix ferrooxidans]
MGTRQYDEQLRGNRYSLVIIYHNALNVSLYHKLLLRSQIGMTFARCLKSLLW